MDTPLSYYSSPERRVFDKMNSDIFALEREARERSGALNGMEDVRLALYRARIALGLAEHAERMRQAREELAKAEGSPAHE